MSKNEVTRLDSDGNPLPAEPKVELNPYHNEDSIEARADCKLCNSQYRAEAEELFDRTSNMKRVHNFLTQDRQEDISYPATRRHLKFHYAAEGDKVSVADLAHEIEPFAKIQGDESGSMIRAMAMIEREMMILESRADGMNNTERRKNADSVTKLGSLLLSYRKELNAMKKQQEPVTLILNQLKIVLQQKIEENPTHERRELAKDVLSSIAEACGTLQIERK